MAESPSSLFFFIPSILQHGMDSQKETWMMGPAVPCHSTCLLSTKRFFDQNALAPYNNRLWSTFSHMSIQISTRNPDPKWEKTSIQRPKKRTKRTSFSRWAFGLK